MFEVLGNLNVCFHITLFSLCPLLPPLLNVFFYQNKGEKMGASPILSDIHTVIIGTMLYLNGGNNGHGLKKRYV